MTEKSLEDKIKEMRELFEASKGKYNVTNDVIAGKTRLTQIAVDYGKRFMESNLESEQYEQYKSEMEGFVAMLAELDTELSSNYPGEEELADYLENEKKFRKGFLTGICGGGAALVAGVLMLVCPPFRRMRNIFYGAVLGGCIAGVKGGYDMKTTATDMTESLKKYFTELIKSAHRVDIQIGLVYAAERFCSNRAAFEWDYHLFFDEEREWCKKHLESMIPRGVLDITQTELEDYFNSLDREVQ